MFVAVTVSKVVGVEEAVTLVVVVVVVEDGVQSVFVGCRA